MSEDISSAAFDPSAVNPEQAAYDRAIRANVQALLSSYRQSTLGVRDDLIKRLGGELGSLKTTSIYEQLRPQLVAGPRDRVKAVLAAHKTPEVPDDIDRMFAAVAENLHEAEDGRAAEPFTVGDQLEGLATSGALADPVTLAKATEALGLLVHYGVYRMVRKHDTGQLLQALGAMETYAKTTPDFNPVQAGYMEAVQNVAVSRGILLVDEQSKPESIHDPNSDTRSLLYATDLSFQHLANAHAYAAVPRPGGMV